MKSACGFVIACLVVSACVGGPPASPVAPSPNRPVTPPPSPVPQPTPAPTPAPSGAPLANLEITSFEIVKEGGPSQGYYWYRPRLTVREVDGKSAALIKSVTLTLPDNSHWVFNGPAGPTGCFVRAGSDRVPAGGTWNIDQIYTYCLDLDTRMDLTGLVSTVAVVFTDEEGRQGTLTGSTR